MCGLAGAAGSLDKEARAAFSDLLYISFWRGVDSTGVACVDLDGSVGLIKSAMPSWEFLDRDTVKRFINQSQCVLLGHTRARTFGEVNKTNAQPFEYEHVVGAHNGTLSYGAKLKLEGALSLPTDSMALYHHLDLQGFKSVIDLTDKDDAMALVWVNRDDHTLHFYRNDKRPLCYVFNKDHTQLFWASEPGFLYACLNHLRISMDKVRDVPVNLHMSFKLPTKLNQKFDKPWASLAVQKDKEVTTYVPRTFFTDRTKTTYSERTNTTTSTATSPYASSVSYANDQRGKVIDLRKFRMSFLIARRPENGASFYKSDGGRNYNREQFDHKMNEGCAVCGITPVWGEPVKFLRDESFMCSGCLQDAKTGAATSTARTVLDNFAC